MLPRSKVATDREKVLLDISGVELERAKALANREINKQKELADIEIKAMKKKHGLNDD